MNNFTDKTNFISQEDKVDVQTVMTKVEEHEGLQTVMRADNPMDVKR
jgi:hypothetical protein